MKIALQTIALIVFTAAAATDTKAIEPSRDEAVQIVKTNRYLADVGKEVLRRAARQPRQTCDWLGYRVQCTRLSLGRREVDRIDAQIRRKHGITPVTDSDVSTLINMAYALDGLAQTGQADREGRMMQYAIVDQLPGWAPFLAYQGSPDKAFLKIAGELAGNFSVKRNVNVTGARAQQLKTIRPSATDFEKIILERSNGSEEYWFEVFAPRDNIIAGDEMEAYWKRFVAFSEQYDARKCGDGCAMAVERQLGSGVHSIALCWVYAARGTRGAPEACQDAVFYDGDEVYIRAALTFRGGPGGIGGWGADDIACNPKRQTGTKWTTERIAGDIASALTALSNENAYIQYAVDAVKSRGGFYSVNVINRYSRSAFIDGKYELSTIRIMVDTEENPSAAEEFSVDIATSFYLSATKMESGHQGVGPTPAEEKQILAKIMSLLPKHLNCKVQQSL